MRIPGNGDQWHYTFIGTGISLSNDVYNFAGSGDNWTIEIDGVSILASTTSGSVPVNSTFAQNLPYGTHILHIKRTAGTGAFEHSEVSFHQPKMPPIPEDAVVISDYMLMADFVPDTVGNSNTISKGVRRNNNSRDLFYDETDNGGITFTMAETSPAGFTIYLSDGSASSATAFKVRLPSFGTNFVHRGHGVAAKSDQYIADTIQTSTDGSATGNTSAHYLASNQTLGVYNWGHNAKSGQAGNVEAYDIVTPIHTSSHYQTFETPFLNELVGGDRNMEQNNLVVTPDGKTWDEVTRDTSYIGNTCVVTGKGDTVNATVVFDEWRGKASPYGYDLYNKNFAIGYDRQICLVDGFYQISCSNISNINADYSIQLYLNGQASSNLIIQSYQTGTNYRRHSWVVNLPLKRGDYIQIKGELVWCSSLC